MPRDIKVIEPFYYPAGTLRVAGETVLAVPDDAAQVLVGGRKASYVTAPETPGGVVPMLFPGTPDQSAAAVGALQSLMGVAIDPPSLGSIVQTFTSKAALFVGTPLVATATATAYRARIASTDLAPVSNWNTNTSGYAIGSKALTTAAGGVGALYRGDIIGVAGSGETYTALSSDSDLSNVGTVTLAGSGLAAAIPAAATLLSVLARGEKIYGAVNCDNAVEAAIACADPAQRDFELTMGGSVIVSSTAPISNIWFTCSGGIAINAHRLDVQFGA